jgi:hypothetical protein
MSVAVNSFGCGVVDLLRSGGTSAGKVSVGGDSSYSRS